MLTFSHSAFRVAEGLRHFNTSQLLEVVFEFWSQQSTLTPSGFMFYKGSVQRKLFYLGAAKELITY